VLGFREKVFFNDGAFFLFFSRGFYFAIFFFSIFILFLWLFNFSFPVFFFILIISIFFHFIFLLFSQFFFLFLFFSLFFLNSFIFFWIHEFLFSFRGMTLIVCCCFCSSRIILFIGLFNFIFILFLDSYLGYFNSSYFLYYINLSFFH
jgi:hypothetical protein